MWVAIYRVLDLSLDGVHGLRVLTQVPQPEKANGRYLCGEECIALNILNDITRRQNGFTYAEAQIQECRRLERSRARLPGTGTGSVTYRPKVSGSLVRRL